MELAMINNLFKSKASKAKQKEVKTSKQHNLAQAAINRPYIIKGIDAKEKGMEEFLSTLGCFEGEKVTVISVLADNYIINIKDARYSIDADLAKTILIESFA